MEMLSQEWSMPSLIFGTKFWWRMKLISPSPAESINITVEFGELKTHTPFTKHHCMIKRSLFGQECAQKPFFFKVGETIDGACYRWMLAHFVCPQMREKGLTNFYFQQDSAPCHTAGAAMQFLQRKFPGHVASKNVDLEWPPRSPDLTVPVFFL